ncbi:hypothetical protein BLNAU_14578 [Blattamonas nauphoetae]|uniref:Uncharacterized protein n=1 Tax=Blattamonas nauphoetae TaxID=2049346 RepID=A0ABQ9XGW4_9EUKA|nr:hypothetical protein BLNAU_14578 [Blattamonas nauphoetae]
MNGIDVNETEERWHHRVEEQRMNERGNAGRQKKRRMSQCQWLRDLPNYERARVCTTITEMCSLQVESKRQCGHLRDARQPLIFATFPCTSLSILKEERLRDDADRCDR